MLIECFIVSAISKLYPSICLICGCVQSAECYARVFMCNCTWMRDNFEISSVAQMDYKYVFNDANFVCRWVGVVFSHYRSRLKTCGSDDSSSDEKVRHLDLA